jgi:protein-disulfide isomerase
MLGSDPRRDRTPVLVALAFLTVLAGPAPVRAQGRDLDTLLQQATLTRVKGPESAPVLVYEFADFQCPHCARFALEVFPRIDSAFVRTGRVRWVFVHLPLPSHPNAWLAHEAAACAGAVADRFWPMHDRLFATQAEWGTSPDPALVIQRLAREVGLPAEPFQHCVAHDRVASVLIQDILFAGSARVNGTPAFIINNEMTVMGLKTFEEWRDLLERAARKPR